MTPAKLITQIKSTLEECAEYFAALEEANNGIPNTEMRLLVEVEEAIKDLENYPR